MFLFVHRAVAGDTKKTSVKMMGQMQADFGQQNNQKSRSEKQRDVRPPITSLSGAVLIGLFPVSAM